ncbi:hypothetical protein BDV09DRAFT_196098 [Aspergillus tetrazonus]
MASLLLIGVILVAVKYADEHVKAKQRDESQSTDAEAAKEVEEKLGEAHMPVETVPSHPEAPPPYERTATLPMYRELEKGSVRVCGLDRA